MIKELNINDQNELDTVMQIRLNENIIAHSFINREYWQDNYNDVKTAIKQALVYLYLDNDKIVGFIGVIKNYIAGLFVSKEAQGKGIGTKLLNHLKKQYSNLTLEVYTQNKKAVTFYKHQDFVIKNEQLEPQTQHFEYLMEWQKN